MRHPLGSGIPHCLPRAGIGHSVDWGVVPVCVGIRGRRRVYYVFSKYSPTNRIDSYNRLSSYPCTFPL